MQPVSPSAVSGICRAKTTKATNAAPPAARKAALYPEVIDDHAGSRPAPLGANPLDCGNSALGQVAAPGAAHDVSDQEGREGAEDAGPDALEHLDADQPEAVIGAGVEHRANGQYGEPGEKQRLASPCVSRTI